MDDVDEKSSAEAVDVKESAQGCGGESGQTGFRLTPRNLITFAFVVLIGWLIFGSGNADKRAVLLVRFRDNPTTDTQLIENTLKIGGLLDCGSDQQYVKVIKSMDGDFDKFGATDSQGSYYIMPAVLNWISSKGWKFQQKFCINLNNDNAEYYFTK